MKTTSAIYTTSATFWWDVDPPTGTVSFPAGGTSNGWVPAMLTGTTYFFGGSGDAASGLSHVECTIYNQSSLQWWQGGSSWGAMPAVWPAAALSSNATFWYIVPPQFTPA